MSSSHDDKPTSFNDFEGTLFGFWDFAGMARVYDVSSKACPPDIEREEETASTWRRSEVERPGKTSTLSVRADERRTMPNHAEPCRTMPNHAPASLLHQLGTEPVARRVVDETLTLNKLAKNGWYSARSRIHGNPLDVDLYKLDLFPTSATILIL